MKTLIIGAGGQLGRDITRTLDAKGWSVVARAREELDVEDFDQVEAAMRDLQPEIVINTLAFHQVELCESEVERAFQVNAYAVFNLAKVCHRTGSTLVTFSTDFVFDGDQAVPYSEESLPNPLNVYAGSKLAGEYLVRAAGAAHFVIRTSGLYGLAGSRSRGGNFVEKMLAKAATGEPVRVVADQILTPTSTESLADAVAQLIRTNAYGLYHISSEGACSWFQFAQKLYSLMRVQVDLKPISTHQLGSGVRRPAYSVLAKGKAYSVGVNRMPEWEVALGHYLSLRSEREIVTGE